MERVLTASRSQPTSNHSWDWYHLIGPVEIATMEMQSIGPDINELGDGSSVRAWLSKKGINKDVEYNHSRHRVEEAQNKTLQHLQKRDETKGNTAPANT